MSSLSMRTRSKCGRDCEVGYVTRKVARLVFPDSTPRSRHRNEAVAPSRIFISATVADHPNVVGACRGLVKQSTKSVGPEVRSPRTHDRCETKLSGSDSRNADRPRCSRDHSNRVRPSSMKPRPEGSRPVQATVHPAAAPRTHHHPRSSTRRNAPWTRMAAPNPQARRSRRVTRIRPVSR